MTQELIINGGVDKKVGIGPGGLFNSFKTGVGIPQLSAIINCADAHGCGGYIISDGGITCGDMAKAFGGGADFVIVVVYFLDTTRIRVN